MFEIETARFRPSLEDLLEDRVLLAVPQPHDCWSYVSILDTYKSPMKSLKNSRNSSHPYISERKLWLKPSKMDAEYTSNPPSARPQQSKMQRRSARYWLTMLLVSILMVVIWPWGDVSATVRTPDVSINEDVELLARTAKDLSNHEPMVAIPELSPRFTDDVQFDNYSLLLKGQRIFL